MQVCTLLQTDNHAITPPLFLQAGCPFCRPTNSVKALKAFIRLAIIIHLNRFVLACEYCWNVESKMLFQGAKCYQKQMLPFAHTPTHHHFCYCSCMENLTQQVIFKRSLPAIIWLIYYCLVHPLFSHYHSWSTQSSHS